MNRIHLEVVWWKGKTKTRDESKERERRTSSLVHLTQVEESLKALKAVQLSLYISLKEKPKPGGIP